MPTWKSRYLYNARTFLHIIFHIYSSQRKNIFTHNFPHLFITYVFASQFNFIQLTQYLVKCRSIKVNVRFSLINSLRYLIFSSVRAVFGRPLPGFRSVSDPRSSARLQIAFTEQSFQPFPEILQQLFGIQNHVSAMSWSELYLHTIFYPSQLGLQLCLWPITKIAIITWNTGEFITMLCCT